MSELKILICDDDPDLLGLLVRRMDKMGVKPDLAENGRTALGLVENTNYDVIVTDIYMPEATGLEVLQHAKQLDQDTQVVIITSSATLDNAIDALNHGAFGYLTKPFDHLIVFDNMVSRAIEYRHLLVAERRKAEAQKRRGDMLEDEVAQRVQQLQKKQKGLLDLLGTLPDGILVIEEGGKVVLSSPVGERWLARDEQSEQRPIHAFISQVHAEMAEPTAQVQLGERELQLMSADFPDDGNAKRKAVIIREIEESGVGAGSLVTDTVMGIRKGLATLYEQGLGTEIVLNLANQFAVLEQLSGWAAGTGQLKPAAPNTPAPTALPATAPEPSPPAAAPAAQDQPPAAAQPPAAEPTAASESQLAADPHPTTVSSTPPFMEPRQRVPTADLDEPRMNTAELQEALRSGVAPQAEQSAEPPAPSGLQMEDTQPAARQAEASAPAPKAEPPEAAPDPQPQAVPAPQAEQPPTPQAEQPPTPQAEQPPTPQAEQPPAPQAEQPPAPQADVPAPPPEQASAPAEPAAAVPEPHPASNGTGELESPDPEPAEFPAAPASTGELDSAVFRPRMIPEEMDAKLETPIELPNANGKRGLLNRAKGPLKISSPQADTQMFRKVLAGLSGSEVEGLAGEKDGPPEIKPRPKSAPKPTGLNPEAPLDDQPEQVTEPVPDPEPAQEPEPQPEPELTAQPQKPKATSWPPKRPSDDPEWEDELDVSG